MRDVYSSIIIYNKRLVNIVVKVFRKYKIKKQYKFKVLKIFLFTHTQSPKIYNTFYYVINVGSRNSTRIFF